MITRGWAFTVYGDPKPKGSMKCVGARGKRKHVLVESTDNAEWRAAIVAMAQRHVGEQAAERQAIRTQIVFTVARPASHYGKRGLLPGAPAWPSTHGTGDKDKLERLVLDALEDAKVLTNDAQVVMGPTLKAYPDTPVPEAYAADVLTHPGVLVRLWPVT